MAVELNRPFIIEKGKRRQRWKIVEHPYFDGCFALVRDYAGMQSGKCTKEDVNHIVYGGATLEKAVETAYDAT